MEASVNDLVVGRVDRVAAGVFRVLAPNASLMTGPGTNTYVIGDPPLAVLDPGPEEPAHVQLLRRLAPRPQFIFATHSHRDHAAGVRALAAATGATVVGLPAPADGLQDESYAPQIHPTHDAAFVLTQPRTEVPDHASAQPAQTQTWTLRAIHTPGHASNHVCFLLEECGMLFSGDHVLDGVTPVILPPDGDMTAYLDSLQRLKSYGLRTIAPGHGRVLNDPIAVVDAVIAHRLRRENKVLAALGSLRRASLDALLPRVYDDVRAELHPIARLQLEAHLRKLVREGRAAHESEDWIACSA
jgi:glyoxylase-like metal-dependent hydrolase (beta-lactamase superfamily II)